MLQMACLPFVQISEASRGINWFLDTLFAMFSSYSEIICNYLSAGAYSHIASHNLQQQIKQRYEVILHNTLKKVEERWREDIQVYSEFVPVDLTVKTLMALLVNPLENTVLGKEHYLLPNAFADIHSLEGKVS